MTAQRVTALGAALAAYALGACSSSSPVGSTSTASLPGTVTVDAASSLTEAFGTLRGQFEADHHGVQVKINFGASSELATQITQGAPVDVFASASQKTMSTLGTAAIHPAVFATNSLEIAVPPGNPGHIEAVADLAKPGIKVAVCDPAVPCGTVAAAVFSKARITVHPVARLADVKSTLAAVESGEVDAGLVYVTDVRAAHGHVLGVAIPTAVNASTQYPIAALAGSRNPALAAAFVEFIRSARAKAVLGADGFASP